jgi:transcriptional regulator with XRE-family HTH domain
MTIGERLKQLREARGLSQLELAKRTGINNHSLSNYERGHRKPPLEAQKKLAEFYNVTIDYLVNGNEEAPVQTLDDFFANNQEIIYNGIPLNKQDIDLIINNLQYIVSMKKLRQEA